MQRRYFFKPTETVEQRLTNEARDLREQARLLPHGAVRDATIRKARQAETGSHINEWLSSPGLRAPT
jgi:hypothetical protein